MNRSSDYNDAVQLHLKVEKGEDGGYKASVPAHPEIPVGTGETHRQAVGAVQRNIQKANAEGKIRGM